MDLISLCDHIWMIFLLIILWSVCPTIDGTITRIAVHKEKQAKDESVWKRGIVQSREQPAIGVFL